MRLNVDNDRQGEKQGIIGHQISSKIEILDLKMSILHSVGVFFPIAIQLYHAMEAQGRQKKMLPRGLLLPFRYLFFL